MAKVTVDNLGPDASTRYALDQQTLQATPPISAPASLPQIDVSSPAFSPEIEQLLQTGPRQNVWASFVPPPIPPKQTGRLFTFCIAPSLGSEEKREALSQKIRPSTPSRVSTNPQGQVLITLLNTISNLDKLLIAINSGRNQFQKG